MKKSLILFNLYFNEQTFLLLIREGEMRTARNYLGCVVDKQKKEDDLYFYTLGTMSNLEFCEQIDYKK